MLTGAAIRLADCCAVQFAWGEPSHLAVGDTCSMVKSFSAADVRAFGGACLDWNPVHYPEGYAEKAALQESAWRSDPATASLPLPTDRGVRRFPGPIVHGMLTASLIGTLFATHLPGAIYLSQSLAFRAPVLYDEPVTARIEVLRLERRGRVVCRTTVEKKDAQGNTIIVIDGEAKVMVESLQQPKDAEQTTR